MNTRFKSGITLFAVTSYVFGYFFGAVAHIRLDNIPTWIYLIGIILIWISPKNAVKPLSKALLLICALAWAYVLCDIPLRLFFIHRIFPRQDEYLIRPWPKMPKLIRLKANAISDHRSYGDLSAISGNEKIRDYRQVLYDTDKYGFRNFPPKSNQPYDVIILGDSIAAGAGTTQEKIFSQVLNDQYGIHTYNMSVPGIGPWNELINLKSHLKNLPRTPDTTVFWILFSGNDMESLSSTANRPLMLDQLPWNGPLKTWKYKLRNFRHKSPLRMMVKYLTHPGAAPSDTLIKKFINGREIAFFSEYISHVSRSADRIQNLPHYDRLGQIFESMKIFSEENKIKVILLTHPAKCEVYSWVVKNEPPWTTPAVNSSFYEGLKPLADKYDLPLIDLTPSMIQKSREIYNQTGKIFWWYDDTHMNVEGHAAVAAQLATLIQKEKN